MRTWCSETVQAAVCVVVAICALLPSGCDSSTEILHGPDAGPGSADAPFGARCSATEECESHLCVRVDVEGGVCTRVCDELHDCPDAPNWLCVEPVGLEAAVCACQPDADHEICGDGIDNDCDGRVDDCMVCDGVQIPPDDPEHCGACDNVCDEDQACEGGECVCLQGDALLCDGLCVDPANDPDHCGGCDEACPGNLPCVNAACDCVFPLPDRCGDTCVNRATDSANCGVCGHVCPGDLTCAGGRCGCANPLPHRCDDTCVDKSQDVNNCGSCGRVCPADQTCVAGECRCPSGAPDVCGSTCVDTDTDASHCGDCHRACAPGLVCSSGECVCPGAGEMRCGHACIDTWSDPANCGDCGYSCAPGERCSGGLCICDSGLVCDGACMPVDDPANCGACGAACGPEQFCNGTACVCSAPALAACGLACFDLASDPLHCGTCTQACLPGELCLGGTCGCPNGSTYCGATAGCVDLANDASHCGACGNGCDPGLACNDGRCVCPTFGEAMCASTGTCTDTLSNLDHCGGCDLACRNGELCDSGRCACPGTTTWCESADDCVDTRSDPQHCGGCDQGCPGDSFCSFSTCRCPSGQTVCPDGCQVLSSDPNNCGACGNVCSGSTTCSTGACRCMDFPAVLHPVHDIQSSTSLSGSRMDVAGGDTGFAVVWDVFEGFSSSVYLQLLSNEGEPVGEPTPVGMGSEPQVIWGDGEWVVAWRGGSSRVVGQRVAPDGTFILGQFFLTPEGEAVGTRAVTIDWIPGRGYVVVYGINTSARIRFLGTTLTEPESPIAVPSTSSSYTTPRTAVAPDGTLGIIYSRVSGGVGFISYAEGAGFSSMVALSTSGGSDDMDLAHDGVTWVASIAASGQTRVRRGPSLQQTTRLDNHTSNVMRSRLDRGDGHLHAAWITVASPSRVEVTRLGVPPDPSSAALVLNPVSDQAAASIHDLVTAYGGVGRQVAVMRQSSDMRTFSLEYPGCP
jgi:hypothetical protein